LLYGKTLNFGFVLDDDLVNRQNAFVQEGIQGIPKILTKGFLAGFSTEIDSLRPQYRPTILVHLAIENEIWGLNPQVNHFFNVFYYGLTGILLFFFIRGLFITLEINGSKDRKEEKNRKVLIPFFITLLFLAHPLHTEVVANIKSRDEIFCFLFLIATLLLLHQFVIRREKVLYGLSVIVYFLALLSKENAIPFLAIIPIYLYCFTEGKLKRIIFLTIPYAVAIVAFLFLREAVVQTTLPVIEPLYNSLLAIPSISHRIATAILIVGKYLWLLIFPHPLVWDYSYNQIPEAGWTNMYVILSLLICIALLTYAIIKLKEQSIISFSILFFFISLSITANLVVFVASNMSERFLYTPSLGFCILLYFLLEKVFKTGRVKYLILSVILILYSYKTITRADDWKDNLTLFTSGIKDSPKSAKTHLAYASELSNIAKTKDSATAVGLYRNAIEEFKIGLAIYPDDPDGWFNLGFAHFYLKHYDEALKAEQRAIDSDPRYAKAYNNIGVIKAMRGELKEALPNFEKAASIDTNYADAFGNAARCYSLLGDYKKASLFFDRAVKLDPFDENMQRNRMENKSKMEKNSILNEEMKEND
jgi:protein O-mannosyl-transferase